MLIQCPECELQVSDKAINCPHCGFPISPQAKTVQHRSSRKHRRLPNGFGQISEIKGRNLRNPYRAMITVGKTETGRPICKPLKPESYFPTYNDAYAALVEYNKNPYDLDPAITVEELYNKWYEKCSPQLSNSSAKRYDNTWLLCSPIAKMRVKDVRIRHIKGLLDLPNLTSKKKVNIKTLLNKILDYAVEYEIVEQNVSRSFYLSKEVFDDASKVTNEHMAFTDEEMEILWKNITNFYEIDTLLIQCYSGWRPQELCLLRLEDVNLEARTFKGGIKTEAGMNREIPIHSKIFDLVKARYEISKACNSEYLFTHNGITLSYDRYYKQFRKFKIRLGLNPHHKPHDGRKHFVTQAKKYNVDEWAIKYIVGHVINDITEKVYTERSSEWLRSEMEKIR